MSCSCPPFCGPELKIETPLNALDLSLSVSHCVCLCVLRKPKCEHKCKKRFCPCGYVTESLFTSNKAYKLTEYVLWREISVVQGVVLFLLYWTGQISAVCVCLRESEREYSNICPFISGNRSKCASQVQTIYQK